MNKEEKLKAVPIYERITLTLEEASALTGIGIGTLKKIAQESGSDIVLFVGRRLMFKRNKLEEYLEKSYSI